MTLPIARDLAKMGIRVVAIAPGIFATPMVRGFLQDVQDALVQQIPFHLGWAIQASLPIWRFTSLKTGCRTAKSSAWTGRFGWLPSSVPNHAPGLAKVTLLSRTASVRLPPPKRSARHCSLQPHKELGKSTVLSLVPLCNLSEPTIVEK